MIFRLKKELFREINDYIIYPENKSFLIKVAKFKKGFYLYNNFGEQIGQIIFKKSSATITAPDSAALTLIRNVDKSFAIVEPFFDESDKKSITDKDERRRLTSEYMIYGNALGYNYDIYEKKGNQKLPQVVGVVINDTFDKQYYKLRINDAGNALKVIMIALAVDKLNLDPESIW